MTALARLDALPSRWTPGSMPPAGAADVDLGVKEAIALRRTEIVRPEAVDFAPDLREALFAPTSADALRLPRLAGAPATAAQMRGAVRRLGAILGAPLDMAPARAEAVFRLAKFMQAYEAIGATIRERVAAQESAR